MSPRPLRIFHLIKSLGRGGAEMLLTDGPRASDPERFQYGFGYFLPHKNALVADLEQSFGSVSCFAASSPWAMALRVGDVARHLREWRADVVHCHLPLAGVVGRLAGRLAHVPVVYTEHNLIERYHRATRLAAQATWGMQRHVITVSSEVQASVAGHFGAAVPVSTIANGISLERFQPLPAERARIRRELRVSDDAPLVGAVAVFRKQKRLDLWLRAARTIVTQRPEVRFVLVGDGPLRAEVEAGIQALGLAGSVLLPGLQADVRPYLAAMDAYLMTSDFEGLPIALLEAMASGLPAVVTDAGGIPGVIEHGRNGFMLARGDVAGIERTLQYVLAVTPEERKAWGAAARSRVAEHFSTARMMRAIERIYLDVASA
jgi:glycosyltransferase involved in cell wall biosynthesis